MKKILYLSIFILAGSFFLNFIYNKKQLEFFVLDVGQGSASLIRTADGRNILIDGGPDAKVLTELGKIMFFYDRVIDVLIVTHSHDDHIGGLIDIFERYDVKAIIYTGVADNTKIYQQFLEAIKNEQSKIIIASAGQEYCLSLFQVETNENNIDCETKIKVLYPISSIENKEIENPNNGSVVTFFEQGINKIIITGDLENEGELELVEAWQNKINFNEKDDVIYVAGHHGSNTSSSKKLLDYIKPDYSIISVGKKNKFGHPSLMILERLKARSKQVWRTDEVGSVKIFIKNNSWIIKPLKISFFDLFK